MQIEQYQHQAGALEVRTVSRNTPFTWSQAASNEKFERARKLEAERICEVEMRLSVEADQNHMKKMLMAMVDNRLGALEAHSAQMISLQSASLESLRELHQKALTTPVPTQSVGMSAVEKDRIIANFAKTLD